MVTEIHLFLYSIYSQIFNVVKVLTIMDKYFYFAYASHRSMPPFLS
jgi:hypothetical protein